jgi:site-specific DNA-cytosine methylase
MRTLVLNTYGGSLLLGAQALGSEIIGSYEDSGFGHGIQQLNFGQYDLRPARKDWPDQNLRDAVVIAHPPCSAFSVQNNSAGSKGVNSDAFHCTKVVLEYAMRNNAVAIAIESVMGALQGAWQVHQQYADDHGYHLYRILQNGAMFGPQWRERFWGVWVKQGAGPKELALSLYPRWETVGQRIAGHEEGPAIENCDVLLERFQKRLREEACCDESDMQHLFGKTEPHHRTTGVVNVLMERKWPDANREEVFLMHVGTFSTGQLCYINPDGLAPCLLGTSWWYTNGRNMSQAAYKRVMGFPADYEFGRWTNAMRTYLSKGVIPQVAEWVLGQITQHLGERHRDGCTCQGCTLTASDKGYHLAVPPNHIADFRFKGTGPSRTGDWGKDNVRLKGTEEQ